MDLVTLITDFGTKDYYVALLKASILNEVQESQIVDINHEISAHDIMDAAFFLRSVYDRFPKGTIHVVHVNSFHAKELSLIIFEYNGYYFIGPNNGVFSLVFEDLIEADTVEIEKAKGAKTLYEMTGKAIRHISNKHPLDELGKSPKSLDKKINLQPVLTANQIRATIIHVDHFGNVIVNLDESTFKKYSANRTYSIYYKSKDPINKISSSYNEVAVGDVCALFTSTGLLEIAVNMGNANKLLSLNKNETIQINFY